MSDVPSPAFLSDLDNTRGPASRAAAANLPSALVAELTTVPSSPVREPAA